MQRNQVSKPVRNVSYVRYFFKLQHKTTFEYRLYMQENYKLIEFRSLCLNTEQMHKIYEHECLLHSC